jgi:poly(ADP-ribose) glycohydrolase
MNDKNIFMDWYYENKGKRGDVPSNWLELQILLEENCRLNDNRPQRKYSFPLLESCLSEFEGLSIFEELIPFLWQHAIQELSYDQHLHSSNTKISLKKSECLSILSKSFFCFYLRNSYQWIAFPSINFDRLYFHSEGFDGGEKPKLQMILHYFVEMYHRYRLGTFRDEEIEFILSEAEFEWLEWKEDQTPLSTFVMEDTYKSLDEAKDCYRIDFANAYLGGASLSYGSVQEEIMFSICPEMNVGRLFSPRMKVNQAICIKGTEQFSLPKGYGYSLEFGGGYEDKSQVIEGKRQSYVVAIDALDFRGMPSSIQYTEDGILRELNKSYAAVSVPQTPATIATGNWGCGVFGGNAELKLLIQWLSASRAGKNICYFPFDNERLYERFNAIQVEMKDKGLHLRVCDVMQFFSMMQPRLVFKQFRQFMYSKT